MKNTKSLKIASSEAGNAADLILANKISVASKRLSGALILLLDGIFLILLLKKMMAIDTEEYNKTSKTLENVSIENSSPDDDYFRLAMSLFLILIASIKMASLEQTVEETLVTLRNIKGPATRKLTRMYYKLYLETKRTVSSYLADLSAEINNLGQFDIVKSNINRNKIRSSHSRMLAALAKEKLKNHTVNKKVLNKVTIMDVIQHNQSSHEVQPI